MDTLPSEMFSSKHSDCEAPISVITKILSENDPIKFENISNEFKSLGFTKVKDLAQITIEKASSIKLSGDSSKLLSKALEMYDKHFDDLQTSANLENENGNFIRSQQICEELLQQKPNDVNVLNLMAESCFKCGNYERSISFLRMVCNLNPNCDTALRNIAFNYWKQSRYDLAKHYLQESILKSPRFGISWAYYAELLVITNEVAMAEYVFYQYLNVYPNSHTIRNRFGKFLISQNKIKDAKRQFKIAQKSDESCETLSNLGDVYFLTDKYDKAIFNYHKALEINPNLKITLLNLGKVYYKIAEYQKAIDTLEKTIKLDPENASALRFLAISNFHQKNTTMGVDLYKKCLKLLPDDFNINLEFALILVHDLGYFQESENYLKKCIQLKPEREDPYETLLHVYKELNKLIDAANICMSLGDLYLKNSDLENARNAFSTALHLSPENSDGHWKLGLVMHKLGRFDLALLRYKKAHQLQLNSDHP